MAGDASFCFYRRMLEGEGPGLVRVAIEAELVLRSGRSQLMCKKTSMRVVAIAAVHQAFIYFVVEGLGKIRLHIEMAGVTKLRLSNFQQLCLNLGSVNGVAINAANIIFNVLRAQKIRVFLAKLMAAKAALR